MLASRVTRSVPVKLLQRPSMFLLMPPVAGRPGRKAWMRIRPGRQRGKRFGLTVAVHPNHAQQAFVREFAWIPSSTVLIAGLSHAHLPYVGIRGQWER